MQNNGNYENILNRGERTNQRKAPYSHFYVEGEDVKLNVLPCLAPVGWIGAGLGMETEKRMARSDFLDLAIYYYVKLENRNGNGMTIVWISQKSLERWGISMRTLEAQALKNMASDGYAINPVEETLNNNFDVPIASEDKDGFSLYVLTNQRFWLGAAGILDKRLVSEFSEKMGKNLYILPSSLHETLIYPDSSQIGAEELEAVIREVNDTQVEPHERLAEHIYYYDRAMDEIRTEK